MRLLEASTLRAAVATGATKILDGSSLKLASRKPMMPVFFHAASRAAVLRFTFWVAGRPLEPTAEYDEAASTASLLLQQPIAAVLFAVL